MDPDPYLCSLTHPFCAVSLAHNFITFINPTTGAIVAFVVAALALLASAFMSGSEVAYFSLTNDDVEKLKSEKIRNKVRQIVERPQQLIATMIVASNLVNLSIVILCSFAMSQIFSFDNKLVGLLFHVVVLLFVLLLFGEIIPKLYSKNHALQWAAFASDGIRLISKVLYPIVKLMSVGTLIVNKVVAKKTDELSLNDLSNALEITSVKEENERTMLKEILKFGGKTVEEVMTPRIDVVDVEWDTSFSQLLEIVRESGYSRMPVYVGNQDNMKGIIYAKDLLPFIGKKDDSFKWQSLMRDPLFVPETRMIDDMLEDFRKKKIHMAIVVDEYGGTQGIVTLEDVLEEIVGEINDEYDDDEKCYTRISADTYLFKGKTPLDDFYRITGLDEHDFDDVAEDAETLAGLLLNIKHDFPAEKEVLEYGRCRFAVVDINKHRIENVKVKIAAEKSSVAEEGGCDGQA